MVSIKRPLKKIGADYRRFEIRCRDESEWHYINFIIQKTQGSMNAQLEKNQKRYFKREIVFMLLEEGQKAIQRKPQSIVRPKRSKPSITSPKKKAADYKRFGVNCKDEAAWNYVHSVIEETQNLMDSRLEEGQTRCFKKEAFIMLLEEGQKVIQRKYLR